MNPPDNDEFFIGWQATQPVAMRKAVRFSVICSFVVGITLAGVFAVSQRAPDLAAYEWSNVQTFEGILKKGPYPHLLVPRAAGDGFSAYSLVGPTKFGVTGDWCGDLDGQPVRFEGGVIFRRGGTMIEVVSKEPEPAEGAFYRLPAQTTTDFGTQTFVGEIVDAKCYNGAMNPGRYKPHRACATVCVAGGIPPMLVVNASGGSVATFLLVGSAGELINDDVLSLLARPVRVSGRLTFSHDLWVFSTDPETIEQL